MKTKEEILKECGFVVTVHEEEIGLVTTAFIEPFMKAMESYASQQIEKYKELILEQDKLIKLQESSQYFEVIQAKEVRRETIRRLKTELGL